MVDRRFKPLSADEQLRVRRELRGDFEEHPGKPVAESIRVARTTHKMTVAELAKISGVSRRTILDIEAGTGNPTLASVEKILRVFGLRVGAVILRSASPVGRF